MASLGLDVGLRANAQLAVLAVEDLANTAENILRRK
jgi:hypothetical protein